MPISVIARVITCALLISIFGVLQPAAPGHAASIATLGTTGSGPASMAIDGSGNIFTGNTGSNNITKITPSGTSTTFGSTGGSPVGITTDSSGNVYVLDGDGAITKFTSSGISSSFATGINTPRAIAADSAGNIYATSAGFTAYVYKYESTGYRSNCGNSYSTPAAIVIDSSNNIFVADEGFHKVWKLTSACAKTQYGSTTGSRPWAIAIDPSGNIFTANAGGKNITKIAPNGTTSTFGSVTITPYGVISDLDGNIYVVGEGNSKVHRFTAAGVLNADYLTAGTDPRAFVKDSAGNLYVANQGTGSVSKITLAEPVFSASTPSIPDTNILSTSATQTETITNTGTANLIYASGAVTLTGTHSSNFAIVADNCSGQSVTPNGTCTVTYTFTPSVTGVRTASLRFVDNASGSPHSVTLSGTGVSNPGFSASTPSIPDTVLQVTSASQTQTITNTGTANLVFGSGAVTLTGTHSSNFAIVADNCSGQSVTPNGTCTVTYTFTPSAAGIRTANLVFTDNASGSPHSVTLSGTGVSPTTSVQTTDNSQAREQAEAKARAVESAKSEVKSALTSGKPLTVDNLIDAEIFGVTSKNIDLVNADIAKLSEADKTDIKQVEKVVLKFATVDKVADHANLYSSDLIAVGLLSADSKNKSSILSQLKKLPSTSLDSFEKIQAAVAAVEKKYADRKARLNAVLARTRR